MASPTTSAKNFEFNDITTDWVGYDSSRDKTNINKNLMVFGSQNVYKKLSGNISVREGQKRLGVADGTISPVSSEFVWNTSFNATYIMVVSKGGLYVVVNDIWYFLKAFTQTRFVFDRWWDDTEKKDRVLFVNGTSNLYSWSGGFTTVSGLSGVVTAINSTPTAGGTGYSIGDILTITTGGLGATVTVEEVDNSGSVTSVLITTGGSGYTIGTGKATSGGSGTGATIDITTVASPSSTTLTKQDVTKSWAQAGFSSTSGEESIVINGVTYTYTGGTNTPTLTGVSPDPSGIANGITAIQSVIFSENTPAAGFNNDFIKVINNQAYVGSYSSVQVYISSSADFTNYTIPDPRAPFDPSLVVLDGLAKGIGVRQGNAYIGFGSGSWAIVTFTNTTDPTTGATTQTQSVDIRPVANLQAPYAHEFIDTVGDSLVYLAQDQQVRLFGDTNNLFTPAYPSFSQEIATELTFQNFKGGGLKCIGEFTYITVPQEGKTYLYQVRQSINALGNNIAERIWHSPFIWNVTRVDEINGTIIGFSNSNPQIYQLWGTDQYHDDSPSNEPLPYECIFATSYRGEQRRQGLWSFDKAFSEGYLTPGTPLNLMMNYNYNGALRAATVVVNSNQNPAYIFTPNTQSLPSLGDDSLGDDPLGDALNDDGNNDNGNGLGNLVKFKRINSLNILNVFEWQPVYNSFAVDAQWEILATGTNSALVREQDATFLITKPISA